MSSDNNTINLAPFDTMDTVTVVDLSELNCNTMVSFNDYFANGSDSLLTDTFSLSAMGSSTTDGKLSLNGPEADVVINGQGLNDRLTRIEQQLNIMVPNPVLEAQWDQLRALGDEYRRLEAELLEKQKAWAALQQT